MSEKSPAFQFYPSDYLADKNTAVMNTEQVGAYHLLMMYCWKEGSLPDDMEELAILSRMETSKFEEAWEKRIQRCFIQNEDGNWIHPRLEKERDKQKNYKDQKKEAGKKGAKKRWKNNKKGSDIAENSTAIPENDGAIDSPMAKNASSFSSSSSPSGIDTHPPRAEDSIDDFSCDPPMIMNKRNLNPEADIPDRQDWTEYLLTLRYSKEFVDHLWDHLLVKGWSVGDPPEVIRDWRAYARKQNQWAYEYNQKQKKLEHKSKNNGTTKNNSRDHERYGQSIDLDQL